MNTMVSMGENGIWDDVLEGAPLLLVLQQCKIFW
jgi:hypothetical protein